MIRSTMHRALSCFVLAGLLAPAFAFAAQPASGLGQAWPNAPDLSVSPRWHVYAFERDGIRYVQINDARGAVRGAFATANGVFLVLPMGTAGVDVGSAAQPSALGETVYRDGDVQVTAAPQANGVLRLLAEPVCKDPVECSTHITTP